MVPSHQYNDPITERAKRLAGRQWRKEAYENTAEAIRHDQFFSGRLWKVVEENIRLWKQRDSEESSIVTDLTVAESALQLLVEGGDDSTAFSTLESGSDTDTDNGKSTKSNYRSSHATPKDSKDELDDTIINEQRLLVEEEDKVKTPPREEKETPLEVKKTPP